MINTQHMRVPLENGRRGVILACTTAFLAVGRGAARPLTVNTPISCAVALTCNTRVVPSQQVCRDMHGGTVAAGKQEMWNGHGQLDRGCRHIWL